MPTCNVLMVEMQPGEESSFSEGTLLHWKRETMDLENNIHPCLAVL
jgi:hypothetical protein